MALAFSSVSGLYVIISFLAVSTLGFPLANKGTREENEVWLPDTNEVGPSPSLPSLPIQPLSRKRLSFKTLVKALYRYQQQLTMDEADGLTTTAAVTEAEPATDSPDDDYSTASPVPPLVDDLSDLFYLTAQLEQLDKSHKFTHSFRFGYGASPSVGV